MARIGDPPQRGFWCLRCLCERQDARSPVSRLAHKPTPAGSRRSASISHVLRPSTCPDPHFSRRGLVTHPRHYRVACRCDAADDDRPIQELGRRDFRRLTLAPTHATVAASSWCICRTNFSTSAAAAKIPWTARKAITALYLQHNEQVDGPHFHRLQRLSRPKFQDSRCC